MKFMVTFHPKEGESESIEKIMKQEIEHVSELRAIGVVHEVFAVSPGRAWMTLEAPSVEDAEMLLSGFPIFPLTDIRIDPLTAYIVDGK
jgi:muconolactone delta-isomerase